MKLLERLKTLEAMVDDIEIDRMPDFESWSSEEVENYIVNGINSRIDIENVSQIMVERKYIRLDEVDRKRKSFLTLLEKHGKVLT